MYVTIQLFLLGETMQWLKRLFGIETETEKLKRALDKEQKLAFDQQRKGDMEQAGKHSKRVEEIVARLHAIEIGSSENKEE